MVKNNSAILIVDDSSITLHFLSELLKGKGYKVLPARNGNQAICAFDNNIVDLVLLDLMMPQMSGFDVLKYIKSISIHKRLPILVISASSDRESIDKAMNMGASEYFIKPLIVEELLKKVDCLLESAKVLTY
jgi:DNA-binding response OmpR family regulator